MAAGRRIGIYGGTFDPIHHAHLILAREAAELFDLEQVIFVPAAASPHKLSVSVTAADVRLEMIRAAIRDEPRFMVDDLELKRPPPSFTIDTMETIAEREPDGAWFLLIGDDQLAQLHTWHRLAELRQRIQFIVLARLTDTPVHEYKAVHRRIDISATEIRNRVASGASIRYLVPDAVAQIIERRQLYRT